MGSKSVFTSKHGGEPAVLTECTSVWFYRFTQVSDLVVEGSAGILTVSPGSSFLLKSYSLFFLLPVSLAWFSPCSQGLFCTICILVRAAAHHRYGWPS